MNKLLTNTNKIKLYVVLMTLCLAISAMILGPFGREGMILFFLSFLITAIGVMMGPITALSVTLFFYFTLGSVLFWIYLTNSYLVNVRVPLLFLLAWAVLILLLSLISGNVSVLIKRNEEEKSELRDQLDTLVVVDPTTGFDNKERMLVELELEYNRSKRYGTPFSFLLIKISHLEQFQKLYGEAEYDSLMQHIAKTIYRLSRISDLKFRVSDDTFALLLTNTPVKDVDHVIEKIDKELPIYQLNSNKFITLNVTYGCAGFPSEANDPDDILREATEQVSLNVS